MPSIKEAMDARGIKPLAEQQTNTTPATSKKSLQSLMSEKGIQPINPPRTDQLGTMMTEMGKPKENKTFLDKTADISNKFLGTPSEFMFGTSAKTISSVIGSGYESAKELITGKPSDRKFTDIAESTFGTKGEAAKNTAFTTLELYPGGGFVSKALRKIPGAVKIAEKFNKLPSLLKSKAIKQFSEALGATTKELKTKTEKIVPTLLERGEKVFSLDALEKKALSIIDDVGGKIQEFQEAIPETSTTATKPVIDRLNQLKSKYIVDGIEIVPEATKAYDEAIKTISQFGENAKTKSILKVRQIFDKLVAKANKNFTKDEGLTLATEAREGMTNAIRNELAKDNPILDNLNKEFTLWKNVYDVVSQTIKRKSTQGGGLSRIIGAIGGGSAGFSSGDDFIDKITKAGMGVFLGQKAVSLFKSPAYKTISAVEKNKLANYMASGKLKEFSLLVTKLLDGIKNLSD